MGAFQWGLTYGGVLNEASFLWDNFYWVFFYGGIPKTYALWRDFAMGRFEHWITFHAYHAYIESSVKVRSYPSS